jgi:hypothetical protein
MVSEAEEFAEQDKKVKERIDARNQLETYVYNMKQVGMLKVSSGMGFVLMRAHSVCIVMRAGGGLAGSAGTSGGRGRQAAPHTGLASRPAKRSGAGFCLASTRLMRSRPPATPPDIRPLLLFSLHGQSVEDKLKDKLEAEDQDKVGAALKEALEWLEENGEAEKEDYEEKLKEVQDVCGPIISKVYAQSGGADGGSGGEEDDLGDHDGEGAAAVEWVQFKRLCLVSSMERAACLTARCLLDGATPAHCLCHAEPGMQAHQHLALPLLPPLWPLPMGPPLAPSLLCLQSCERPTSRLPRAQHRRRLTAGPLRSVSSLLNTFPHAPI